MNRTGIVLAAAAAATTISIAGVGSLAWADPVHAHGPGQPLPGPTTSIAHGRLWGNIDTGNATRDAQCSQLADDLTAIGLTVKAGSAEDKSNTQIANTANQNGCRLFPA